MSGLLLSMPTAPRVVFPYLDHMCPGLCLLVNGPLFSMPNVNVTAGGSERFECDLVLYVVS